MSDAPCVDVADVGEAVRNVVGERSEFQGCGGIGQGGRTDIPLPADIAFFSLSAFPVSPDSVAIRISARPGPTFDGHTLSQERQRVQAETLSLYFRGSRSMPRFTPTGPGMKYV